MYLLLALQTFIQMTLVQVSARGGHSGALQLLNFFFLSTSRYAWPQEISLSDLSPDCCDKTILDVKAMTLTLRSSQVSADGSISTSHLFHHNLKEEMMGRYLSPQETNEGFCAGVPDTRQDFGGGGTHLSCALSDGSHPLHCCRQSNRWRVLIGPCLTGN